jgi:hypothetical protein
LTQSVVSGLVAKGESKESLRTKIAAIFRWVMSSDLRAKDRRILGLETIFLSELAA